MYIYSKVYKCTEKETLLVQTTDEGISKVEFDLMEVFVNENSSRYTIVIDEMKSLLSLEGLRPPLSRDSSTYTHVMSYFACMNNNNSDH